MTILVHDINLGELISVIKTKQNQKFDYKLTNRKFLLHCKIYNIDEHFTPYQSSIIWTKSSHH